MVMLTDLPSSARERNVNNAGSGCLPQVCWFCFKQCSQLNLRRPQGFHLPTRIRIDGSFSAVPRSGSKRSRLMLVDSCDVSSDCLPFPDPFPVHNVNSSFMPPLNSLPLATGDNWTKNPLCSKQTAWDVKHSRKSAERGWGSTEALSSRSFLISCTSTLYNVVLFAKFW